MGAALVGPVTTVATLLLRGASFLQARSIAFIGTSRRVVPDTPVVGIDTKTVDPFRPF